MTEQQQQLEDDGGKTDRKLLTVGALRRITVALHIGRS